MKKKTIPYYPSELDAFMGEKATAKKLCNKVRQEIRNAISILHPLAGALASISPRYYKGISPDALTEWSDISDIPYYDLLLANLSYEMSQVTGLKWFGCTAAAIMHKTGPVHIRNMDWELPNLGNATVIVETEKYVSVTLPGLIGAISGMVPGEYSITLNWLPPERLPITGWSPLGLIAHVLDTCTTYKEAKTVLSDTPLNSCAAFLLTGTKTACVIERTQRDHGIRIPKDGVIAVSNHFKAYHSEYTYLDDDVYEDSLERLALATDTAHKYKNKPITSAHQILNDPLLLNENTSQQMVFQPKTGYYEVRTF